MSLTALQIRAFSPGASAYKRADARGLYLEIFPNGSKLWRLKYYVGGKEKRIALGAWPEVSLQAARLERDELRLRIAKGEDPALTRKKNKATAKISAANTFESVAREYIENKMVGEGRAEATDLWRVDVGNAVFRALQPKRVAIDDTVYADWPRTPVKGDLVLLRR